MLNPTLADLYQRVILEQSRAPHGLGPLAEATHSAALHNALCGDQITLRLRVENSPSAATAVIAGAGFEGESCALCRASASLLCRMVAGGTPEQALVIGRELQAFLRPRPASAGTQAEGDDAATRLGELVALAGVRDFPSRLRCATLPWEALAQALAGVS